MGFRGSEKFLKLYAVLFVNTNNLCVCFLEKSSIPLLIISKGSMIPKGLTTTWTGITLCISAIKTLLLNVNYYSLDWRNPFLGIPHQEMRLLCNKCLLFPRVVDKVQKNEANSRYITTEIWHSACTCCDNTVIEKNKEEWFKNRIKVEWRKPGCFEDVNAVPLLMCSLEKLLHAPGPTFQSLHWSIICYSKIIGNTPSVCQ